MTSSETLATDPPHLTTSSLSRHQKISNSLLHGHNIVRVNIPSFHIADEVVVYEVDVSNKKLRWNLWLRYEFFHVLHQMMQELVSELSTPESQLRLPPFPEKHFKLFTDHFNNHFIENRRMLLDNYLQQILQNRFMRHSEIFISFLTPPINEELDIDSSSTENENENENEISNGNTTANASATANIDHAENKNDDQKVEEQNTNKEVKSFVEHCLNVKVEFVDVDENDEITDAIIPQAQILKHDHTIYQVHVFNINKRQSFSEWTVLKRFGEFHDFDCEIRKIITEDFPFELHKLPPLPPKYLKVLVDHLDVTFVEKRRLLLQGYIQRLLKYPLLRRNELTLQFLGVYS